MIRYLLALCLALPVAAPTTAQVAKSQSYSDRLAKLDGPRRLSVLRRAVLDAGQPCKRVTAGAIRGRYRNLVMWTARCTPGGDYGVFIGPDGSVQVRGCLQMARLKLPGCAVRPTTR